MKLETLDLKKILPGFMKEDEFDVLLADAITEVLQDSFTRVKTLRTWDQIDNLTSEELDELAWELNIDWWESEWDIEIKRATINESQKINEKRGTKYSVEKILESVFGTGTVLEWFEYSGSPYHFKVYGLGEMTEERIEKFRKLIEITKPARAVLDSIESISPLESKTYLGAVCQSHNKNVIVVEET